jgi:hypothetical protein
MTAAAELMAELGWGRVTTRVVATRAGLPRQARDASRWGSNVMAPTAAVLGKGLASGPTSVSRNR